MYSGGLNLKTKKLYNLNNNKGGNESETNNKSR